jgi:hypothetical protein
LNNLEFPEIRSLIVDDFQREMEKSLKFFTPKIIEMLYQLGKNVIDGNLVYSIENYNIILEASKNILDGFGYIMDMYLFSRMFRKFKKTKTMSEPPTNIVVVVGNWHANNYRRLLDKLGFTHKESKSETKDVDFQCVNISNFSQPFFSEHNLKPNEVYA